MCPDVIYGFIDCCKSESRDGICAAVVDSYASRIGVAQGGAWKRNVGHVTDTLVHFTWVEQVVGTSVSDLPRLVNIQNAGGKAVHKAVARLQNAVIEAQPTIARLDRDRARTYLFGFPRHKGGHNVPVLSPILHIGGVGDIDISERCMAVI